MKAYVINMPKSTQRRKTTQKMLEDHNIDYEFITAVDGREMTEEKFIASVQDVNNFSRSQAGCGLSHVKAYHRILEGNDEFALVLEDDVLITEKDLNIFLDNIESKLDSESITLLTYYWCREGYLDLTPTNSITNNYNICKPSEIHGVGRAAAYIISKETCKKLIAFNTPLYAQADSWVVFHNKGVIKDLACVYPMPIRENIEFGSEIVYTKGKTDAFLKKLVTKAVENRIPIITPLIMKKRERFTEQYMNIRLIK